MVRNLIPPAPCLKRTPVVACFLAAYLACMLSACGMLDSTLSSRTYTVNESGDAVLNNSILLNIIRAENSEPLSFVAIARYSAEGQLTAGAAMGPLTYTIPNLQTYGPISLGSQVTGSFDLNVLETKEFYQGILQNLDPIAIELWFRQGLPHDLVFYMLLDAVRVSTSDGVYEYVNDPTHDAWTDEATGHSERMSANCRPRPIGRGDQTNYDVDPAIWHGVHGEDCRFHKFQYFLKIAVKYGLRIETVVAPALPSKQTASGEAAEKITSNTKKTALATPNAVHATTPNAARAPYAGEAGEGLARKVTQICYDAATLRAVHADARMFTVCGTNKVGTGDTITLGGIGAIKDAELVMRSGFGVFQYLGRILRTGSADSPTLGSEQPYFEIGDNDHHLLTVVQGAGPDCFAIAQYRSSYYCVPKDGAENTKRIFMMLRAMLATNISAISLNATPSIRVTP